MAAAASGAALGLDGPNVGDAGIALTAVGAPHNVGAGSEAAIRGRPAEDATIELAGTRAAAECNPHTDQRGPADYKRALAGELVKRALRTAIARCRGEEQ